MRRLLPGMLALAARWVEPRPAVAVRVVDRTAPDRRSPGGRARRAGVRVAEQTTVTDGSAALELVEGSSVTTHDISTRPDTGDRSTRGPRSWTWPPVTRDGQRSTGTRRHRRWWRRCSTPTIAASTTGSLRATGTTRRTTAPASSSTSAVRIERRSTSTMAAGCASSSRTSTAGEPRPVRPWLTPASWLTTTSSGSRRWCLRWTCGRRS